MMMRGSLTAVALLLVGCWLPTLCQAVSATGRPMRYDLTKGLLESITSTPVEIGTAKLKDLATALDMQLDALNARIKRSPVALMSLSSSTQIQFCVQGSRSVLIQTVWLVLLLLGSWLLKTVARCRAPSLLASRPSREAMWIGRKLSVLSS